MAALPVVTIAVPSYNQGRFLDAALTSIFEQDVPVEVYVADGGSTDDSVDVIRRYEGRLAGWRSHPDQGQAAAINEGIAKGSAPYVAWLNSDDQLEPGGLKRLLHALEQAPKAPVAYGKVWNYIESNGSKKPIWVEPFSERRLALRCIVSQPGTLMRRAAWDAVSGLDGSLRMAMDYDLWWRLYREFAPFAFVDEFVAVNRDHLETKTNTQRVLHYREAMAIVRKYHGRVPLKWWLAQPYAVWLKALTNRVKQT
ncbi:glycosyltransferase family 2 protein [Tardiphaga sp. 42S5]|jgi:glycosyltransferase involved in cell wall biosynthesis|uniref:glycosyltransferase family 2 protein n=1 Tax=Tardiphaga sp. 42S5 TaxID=1404799 RepID=UPI002A5A8F38|nr:glycosyltransferase family 2 protein [Tardiphaga sp. 42S5]WPO44306.1 glycosyltransferase family 2 protein [Tardiphaga sp. 42S5]